MLNYGVASIVFGSNTEDEKKRQEFKNKIFNEETLRDPKSGLRDEDFEPLLENTDETEEGAPSADQDIKKSNTNDGIETNPEKTNGDGESENSQTETGAEKTKNTGETGQTATDVTVDNKPEIPRNTLEKNEPDLDNSPDGENGTGPSLEEDSEYPKNIPETTEEKTEPKDGDLAEEKKVKEPKDEDSAEEKKIGEGEIEKTEQKPGKHMRRNRTDDEGYKNIVPLAEEQIKKTDENSEKDKSPKDKGKTRRKYRRNAPDAELANPPSIDGEDNNDMDKTEQNQTDAGMKTKDGSLTPELDRLEKKQGEKKSESDKEIIRTGKKQEGTANFDDKNGETPVVRKRKPKKNETKDEGILEKIYNITDSGVSEDFLFSEQYSNLLRESEKINLKKSDIANNKDIPVLYASTKNIKNFRTSDIPEELLTFKRSESNAHIPNITSLEDIQDTAKKAIVANDLAALRGIIESVGNSDFFVDSDRTVLEFSIENGSYYIVRYLIYSGASINKQGRDLNTPLHVAVNTGNIDLVKLLIESGSAIDSQNSSGRTPLMLAIVKNHENIAYELLKNGAKMDIEDSDGKTAYSLCLGYNRGRIQQYLTNMMKTRGVTLK
ncbi:MAG: ankyrin repeat domain-containing protein [Rickettsiales bacterium]|nr:ankyrin repeat domain-containing protein [Rickettsiales bacterium]